LFVFTDLIAGGIMGIRQRAFVATAGVLALAACAQPAGGPAVDLGAEEQAVRDASMAWLEAMQARDLAAAAANFAGDGIAYSEHEDPLVGPAAIQADMEARWEETPNLTVSWSTDRVIMAASGDLAVEFGTYTFNNEGEEDTGKYVTAWRKIDGAWKVAADIGVSTVPE
jgi:ketosteroid isomerase-like protein